MHHTAAGTAPPAPQQQQQRQEQLKELERTMKSLEVNENDEQNNNNIQQHLTESAVKASSSFDENDAEDATLPTVEGDGATPISRINNSERKKSRKCLNLIIVPFPNGYDNTTAGRFPENGIISPRQLQSQQPSRARFHRQCKLFPVHILPCLFLGNDETAKNRELLAKSGISYVINVTSDLPNYFEGENQLTYLRIPVDDNSSHNLAQFFPEAISLIEKARFEGAAVLVHCWAGISRSVTICLAYLMYALRCTMDEAFDRLQKQNGRIAPNFHFMEALTCWQRELESCSFSHSAMGINLPPGHMSKNGFHHDALLNATPNNKSPHSPSAFHTAQIHSATAVPF